MQAKLHTRSKVQPAVGGKRPNKPKSWFTINTVAEIIKIVLPIGSFLLEVFKAMHDK